MGPNRLIHGSLRVAQSNQSGTIYLPNTDLAHEIAGLQALLATSVPVFGIELGNEMYDMTVPAIQKRYPNITVYATAAVEWIAAIRQNVSGTLALVVCGGLDATWNQQILQATGHLAQGLTQHVYTQLPEGPYDADPIRLGGVSDQTVVAFLTVQSRIAASALPATMQLWFTEIGRRSLCGLRRIERVSSAEFLSRRQDSMGRHMHNVHGSKASPWFANCFYCHVCRPPRCCSPTVWSVWTPTLPVPPQQKDRTLHNPVRMWATFSTRQPVGRQT